MDVSIIIVNYNTFDLTCGCIASILSRTTGCSFEIVLVDNASTDKDPTEFVRRFPMIKLVKNSVNTGFAKGNNAGIEKATGENILLLNSDTELLNNAVYVSLQSLKENRLVAAVGCRLTYPDGQVQHNCQRFPSIKYKVFELLRLQKLLPSNVAGKVLLGSFFDHSTPVFVDWIWGTFFLFRKDLLRLLPGNKLADDFFMYVEDMQWCMDFRKLGFRIAFEPRAHVCHFSGQSNGNKLPMMEANTHTFMRKYFSPWQRTFIKRLDKWLL